MLLHPPIHQPGYIILHVTLLVITFHHRRDIAETCELTTAKLAVTQCFGESNL